MNDVDEEHRRSSSVADKVRVFAFAPWAAGPVFEKGQNCARRCILERCRAQPSAPSMISRFY